MFPSSYIMEGVFSSSFKFLNYVGVIEYFLEVNSLRLFLKHSDADMFMCFLLWNFFRFIDFAISNIKCNCESDHLYLYLTNFHFAGFQKQVVQDISFEGYLILNIF